MRKVSILACLLVIVGTITSNAIAEDIDDLSWCCNVLKTYEDFVPWVTWGSLRDQETRNTWNTKNCNHLVGGSEKSQCSGTGPYVPGTPGGPWTESQVDIVRSKVLEMIDVSNYVPKRNTNLLHKKERAGARRPTENKLLRLTFHDCLKYVDGTGGCDGCLNWKGMGFRYTNLFTHGKPKPPENSFPVVHNTDNNDLAVTAESLERIYTTVDWPPRTPVLEKSLQESGISRADLWAFSANVALERAIERANYACDHDYTSRQQIRLLEGREKCEFKLNSPMKFQYGRSDCLPTNDLRPFEASKEEVHPRPNGDGKDVLDFMKTQFNLNANDTVALLGIHSVSHHPNIVTNNAAGMKYAWIGTPYLSSMYYKQLAGKPIYRHAKNSFYQKDIASANVAIGNGKGEPVGGYGFRGHCKALWDAPEGGPCFFRPIMPSCPDQNPNAEDFRENCFGGFDSDGNVKLRDDDCCKDATIDERGVQSGGCEFHECGFDTHFLLNMEMGLYYNITVDEFERPHRGDPEDAGCAGLETDANQWKYSESFLGDGHKHFGSPSLHCGKSQLAPEGTPVTKIVDAYANDHDVWTEDFLKAWPKMQHNGYAEGSLKDGPQNSWLGYVSLKEANVNVGDFTAYIEQNKPLWFTRHDDDLNPAICGECWLRFK